MGRPKQFIREEVLRKALALFWQKGISATTVQDLEVATGVNKSGLYSEFANKEDIFLASLRYYLENRGGEAILTAEPKGWDNIQRLLETILTCFTGERGCFAVNSMRDAKLLPARGLEMIAEKNANLRRLIIANIRMEAPRSDPGYLADLILTFFSGLCVEQNMTPAEASIRRKIQNFMRVIRQSV